MNGYDGHEGQDGHAQDGREDVEMQRLLRDALDAEARIAVPDHRHPPAIDWPETDRGPRRWLTPLAVAAAVIVVAGSVGVVASRRGAPVPTPAGTRISATATPSPTSTGQPTGAPTSRSVTGTAGPSAPSSATSTHSSGSVALQAVAGGATIAVPAGWTLRARSGGGASEDEWCLEPVGTARSTSAYPSCTITLARSASPGNENADTVSGLSVNPEFCDPVADGSYTGEPLKDYQDTTFGGRAGEYRFWSFQCDRSTRTTDVVQYQVLTPASWVVYSEHADQDAVKAAVDTVATGSTLPAQTSTTRVYDRGIVRSAVRQQDGSTVIEVDRVIVGWPNQSSAVYSYRVPAGVLFSSQPAGLRADQLTGRTVSLNTDGQVVTRGYVESS